MTVDVREFCQPFSLKNRPFSRRERSIRGAAEWKSESNSSSGSRWVQRSPVWRETLRDTTKRLLNRGSTDPYWMWTRRPDEARVFARCRDLALSRLLILERRLNVPILSRNTSARREFYRSHVRYMRMNFQKLIETRTTVHGTSWLANFLKLPPSHQLVPMKLTMERRRESEMKISRFIGETRTSFSFYFFIFFFS